MIEWAIFNREFFQQKLWNVQRTIKSAKDNFFSLFTSGFWSTLGEADFLNSMNNLQPKRCKHTFNDPWFNIKIELIQEPWNLFMELMLILRTPDQILPTKHSSKHHCFGLRQIQRILNNKIKAHIDPLFKTTVDSFIVSDLCLSFFDIGRCHISAPKIVISLMVSDIRPS